MADQNKLNDKSSKSINDASLDFLLETKNLRLRILNNKFVISNININSLPNRLEQLKELLMKHIDVFGNRNKT